MSRSNQSLDLSQPPLRRSTRIRRPPQSLLREWLEEDPEIAEVYYKDHPDVTLEELDIVPGPDDFEWKAQQDADIEEELEAFTWQFAINNFEDEDIRDFIENDEESYSGSDPDPIYEPNWSDEDDEDDDEAEEALVEPIQELGE